MAAFIIKFIGLVVSTYFIIYFLNKEYKLNWKLKKIVTNSRYSKYAYLLSIVNIIILSNLFDVIHNKYLFNTLNTNMNKLIEWVIIPLVSILIFISIFYSTYSQFKAKKELGVKDE